MGTIINLSLARLDVDWGGNDYFINHGSLYQDSDFKSVPTYYAAKDWPNGDSIVDMNEGLGKPLGQVADRLKLLGITPRSIKHDYIKSNCFQNTSDEPVLFEALKEVLEKIDINRINGKYRNDYKPGEFIPIKLLEKLSNVSESYGYKYDELRPDHWEIDLIVENIGAYGALYILAENENNRKLDVSWNFTPLVESGYATREEFQPGALPEQKFLIVTEGSSDAKIIRKALQLLRPHIADFFRFVDMEDGYPFSGTGNLYRFSQGLASIDIQNNTVIVYDNDAEGVSKLNLTSSLSSPKNMRAIQLPKLKDFENFKTIGPAGVQSIDINGKAAAIECYLDLSLSSLPVPQVRWTSFNSELDVYHGELEAKSKFMKSFLNLREPPYQYDFSKIEVVLDAIIAECILIAENKKIDTMI